MLALFNILTPNKGCGGPDAGDYPDNKFCTCFLKKQRRRHQYTYIFTTQPEIEEGSSNERCDDCLEHRHTRNEQTTSIITCGNSVDPQLRGGASPLNDIKFTFKSDGSNGFRGADFYIAEFSPIVSLHKSNASVMQSM